MIPIPEEEGFYVYLLECRDHTFYCGWTNQLKKRLAAHNEGRGAKYTKGRGPCQFVYVEDVKTKSEALRREYEIKQLSRQEKMNLIQKS